MRGGSEDFYEHFKGNLLPKLSSRGQSISREDVHDRFFSFYQEIPGRRKRLEQDLKRLLGKKIPPIKKESVNEEILKFKDEGKDFYAQEIDKFAKIKDETEKAKKHYERLKKREPDRKKGHKIGVERVEREIAKLRERELENFRVVFEEETKVEKIEQMIKDRYEGIEKKRRRMLLLMSLQKFNPRQRIFGMICLMRLKTSLMVSCEV